MSERLEYDVIIIGAGLSGGLPAGAYLAKAGAKVLMLDANQEVGTHCKSNELVPGALATPGAAGYAGATAPMWEDLELEKYGVQLMLAHRTVGCTFPDGKNLSFGPPDMEGTVRDMARFSERDAETFAAIAERNQELFVELNRNLIYSEPTEEKLEWGYEKFAYVWGREVEDFEQMNAFELVNATFESDHIKQALVQLPMTFIFGDPGEKGQGAFALAYCLLGLAGQLKAGNHSMVHALCRVFLDGGGDLWRNAPVAKILTEDGKAVGVQLSDSAVMHPGENIFAKHAVLSNVGAKHSLELVGHDLMKAADPRLFGKMKRWDNSSRPSTGVLYALRGYPKLKSLEWDPNFAAQDFFYKGLEKFEDWYTYYMALKSGDFERAWGGWWEFVIPAALDKSQQSPDGILACRIEIVMPAMWRDRDGTHFEKWDDVKHDILERVTDSLEEMAPGFREQIVASTILSPLDWMRANKAAEWGNAVGGSHVGDQFYLDRMPYRMPIENLYMCNSVFPVSLSWGATGYIAADLIARDMGIRDQDWWVHEPCGYVFKNLEKLLARH